MGKLVRGKWVLVVNEVDDSQATLKYCMQELKVTNAPAEIAVVHNKLKPKRKMVNNLSKECFNKI